MNSFESINQQNKNSTYSSRKASEPESEKENIDIELISATQRNLDAEDDKLSSEFDIETQKQSGSINRRIQNGELKSQKVQSTQEEQWSKKKIFCWVVSNLLGVCLILLNQMFISQKCIYSSDQKCQEMYFEKRLYLWVAQAVLNSAICTMWILKFLNFNQQSSFYAFLYILTYFIIHMFGDQIGTRVYTGLVNKLQQILLYLFLIIGVSILIYKKYKRKLKKILLWSFFCFMLIGGLLMTKLTNSVQCNSQNQGINGQIQQSEILLDDENVFDKYKPLKKQHYCSLLSPSFCWFYSLDSLLNVQSYFPQYTCQNIEYSEKTLDQYIQGIHSNRYLGFPTQIESQLNIDYQSQALQQVQGYNSIQEAIQQGHEVILDQHNLKYHIKVIKNTTLADERDVISSNKETKSIVDNILLINVNGLSRIQMHAKLPLTIKWFDKFQTKYNLTQSNKEEGNSAYISLEYVRYNSFNYKKDIQSLQFFYGQGNFEPTQNKIDSIFDFFKSEGFITGYSNTFCESSSFEKQKKIDKFLNPITKDHDSSSTFGCDPNFEDPYQSFKWMKGSSSYFQRCLYGEQIQSYSLNYTQSFFEQYSDNKKFFMLEFAEGRERTGQVVKNLDEELSEFFENNKALLSNTLILVMSSQSQPKEKNIYSKLELEAEMISKKLPVLLMRVPPTINSQYRKNLIQNSQRLVTIRNVHFTLKHIANGTNYNQFEESLLSPQKSFNQCPDVGISKKDCSCEYPIQI